MTQPVALQLIPDLQRMAGLLIRQSDGGPKPEMLWVPVSALRIDPGYQRRLSDRSKAALRRIIEAFSWARFGAIICVREGETYRIVDGQHRGLAALHLGLSSVPAMVTDAHGVEGEAADFVGINSERTSLATVDKFRAAVMAGDEAAAQLDEMLQSLAIAYDLPPGTALAPRQTVAISRLRQAVAKFGRGPVFTALEMLIDAGEEQGLGLLTAVNIWSVCFATEKVIAAEGDIDRLARVVAEADFERIAQDSTQMIRIVGGQKRDHAAELLLQAYDKGLKSGRLSRAGQRDA